MPLIEEGKIQPVVYDKTYDGPECVPRALEDIATREVWGKAVIIVDSALPSERVATSRL